MFLSDWHLGTRGCNASKILDFLKDNDAETIYLVGDIIDGWRLSRKFYWPQSHNDIVQKILRKARKGTKVFYIPGNHDEAARDYIGHTFGGIEIVEEAIHITADGKRVLVLHGDKFDGITKYHKWLALLGDFGYMIMLDINKILMHFRRKFGLGHWSLSAYVKHKVKQAANFINDYENTVADECHKRGFDIVVCGHIHHAEIKMIGDIQYCNIGDFVESCTALVEDHQGNFTIINTLES